MIEIADEVRDALADQRPVVALESTIIAHGFPFPDNLTLARDLEATVRRHGAVPATIAVVDGVPRVGLSGAQLEHLATPGAGYTKAGAADLAPLMALGQCAATTVSATSFLAAQIGIEVFATGGIGGVHRDDPADVSSDLATLAGMRLGVVSSGAKAILDLRRTVEKLESLGVLVVGYRTDEFPAFYSRTSGLSIEHRVDNVDDLARTMAVRFALGQGGVLIANPVPVADEIPAAEMSVWIDDALAAAARERVEGKRLTPFLLARIASLSGGRAVSANRALALSNAELAAQVAHARAVHR